MYEYEQALITGENLFGGGVRIHLELAVQSHGAQAEVCQLHMTRVGDQHVVRLHVPTRNQENLSSFKFFLSQVSRRTLD
jgi:hypothetical protein